MENQGYNFETPLHQKSYIKVIGVGGGGSNAVTYMHTQGIKDVEFYICNTDVQALEQSSVPNKMQIGIKLTGGLGAGANPEKGKNAAIENEDEIKKILEDNTKMLFITAGMGGGTGTGAAPIIAKVSKELNILTVGIVTFPFPLEGKKKEKIAQKGIEELKQYCDTVLVIMNGKLMEMYGNLSTKEAFSKADSVLSMAAKGIAEIITCTGAVNVDFEDVNTVMRNAGTAMMGMAVASGENRVKKLVEDAISSPLLDCESVNGAKYILFYVSSGKDANLQMSELEEIGNLIKEAAGDEADVIFGQGEDERLDGASIGLTVIVTGFDSDNTKQAVKTYTHLSSGKKVDVQEDEAVENKDILHDLEGGVKRTHDFGTSFPEEKSLFVKDDRSKDYEENLQKRNAENEESKTFASGQMSIEEAGSSKKGKNVLFSTEAEKEKYRLEKERNERKKSAFSQHPNSTNVKNDKDYDNIVEYPAYLRKNISLYAIPHSSEREISRVSLDGTMMAPNRHLHNKPD